MYIRIHPPSSSSPSSPAPLWEILDGITSSWAQLTGEPVVSVCIMLVLALSVSFNGYLLKGIAAPLLVSGFAFRWDQSEAEKAPPAPAPAVVKERTIVIVPPQQPQQRIEDGKTRSLKELVEIFENGVEALRMLSDEEVIKLAQHGKIQAYNLEKVLDHYERAVKIRRVLICERLKSPGFALWQPDFGV